MSTWKSNTSWPHCWQLRFLSESSINTNTGLITKAHDPPPTPLQYFLLLDVFLTVWLYINYQLDSLIIISFFLYMFRALSAHLQEDTVVHTQHMALSLYTTVRGGLSVQSLSFHSNCVPKGHHELTKVTTHFHLTKESKNEWIYTSTPYTIWIRSVKFLTGTTL